MHGERSKLLDPRRIVRASDVRQGHTVIDIQCGHRGHCVFESAAHAGESGLVYAVDLRKSAIETLKSMTKLGYKGNIQILRGDAETPGGIKLKPKSADRIFLVDALSSAKNHLAVVQQAQSLLKSGGTLTVVDWHPFGQSKFGPHPNHRISEKEAISTCLVTGLDLIGNFKAGEHHYAFVCKKI